MIRNFGLSSFSGSPSNSAAASTSSHSPASTTAAAEPTPPHSGPHSLSPPPVAPPLQYPHSYMSVFSAPTRSLSPSSAKPPSSRLCFWPEYAWSARRLPGFCCSPCTTLISWSPIMQYSRYSTGWGCPTLQPDTGCIFWAKCWCPWVPDSWESPFH